MSGAVWAVGAACLGKTVRAACPGAFSGFQGLPEPSLTIPCWERGTSHRAQTET